MEIKIKASLSLKREKKWKNIVSIYCCLSTIGRPGITLTSLTPPYLCACPKTGPGFSNVWCRCFSPFCTQWVKVSGDCLFCWYCGNCWPSLFKLSFHFLLRSTGLLDIFIRYIYYWNLQFLNNVIINKTKFLLPREFVTLADFGYPV